MKFRIATVPLGKKAKVTLLRPDQKGKGQELNVYVEAIAPPEDPPREETPLSGAHALNGALISNMNPAVAIELGLDSNALGVVVTGLKRGTSATRIVSVGDLLLEINGQEIKDVDDVEKALSRPTKNGLSLIIKSAGRVQQILIR